MKVEISPWAKMMPRPEAYCYPCDEFVQLVQKTPGIQGSRRCPLCGRRPGALELGIRSEPEQETLDELKRMYGPREELTT